MLLILTGIALIVYIIAFFIILIKNYQDYSKYCGVLNSKEYPLKSLLPLGLYILDKFCYSFNSAYDRRTIGRISEIYGQEYSAFYIRIFHAKKIILMALIIPGELLVGILSDYQAVFSIYTTLLFGIMIFLDDTRLTSRIKKRRLEIQLEFPDFINKLTLLLNAGLTMSKAWEKISLDSKKKCAFYKEVEKTVSQLKTGVSESEAFGEFAKRLKTPEISRVMSSIIQNTKKGGNELVLTLKLQSNESWELRKNVVRRLGEEASTKLLFPMMIMFFAIIIIVITPALISMQGISNF
ncbi:type II secretion system F family protein [Ruminiclostridium papyrosolvens]|uniref:Type II secretion protein F n=1 Tax=Ruminiclostridium papyrosolvens C7 TaxID=1330534 RepID=U4QYS4_9FIRM|nr:type II secretion system F family protein [Ruminiclostridium papyrosolvens]EPR08298.1 type II secretion protein F [Ruminiclostridium papyrosolvens C7]